MARNKKAPRTKLHQVTAENDIRYRGPLTYQHFQILGWLCIVLSQARVILALGGKVDPSIQELYQRWQVALQNVGGMSLPLLLIANFAQILDTSDGYKKQLIKNAGAALGVFLLSIFCFDRYIMDSLAALSGDTAQARTEIRAMIQGLTPTGFISFNLFIDLLLCTLVMLFLNYKPKHIFRGKLLHVFRLFVLLPIGYEVGCMVLKVLCARRIIQLPLWCFPLLPVKPPMTFVLFVILAFFVKIRELRFRRHGKTHEEYHDFLKTNRNSRNFSIFLAGMMVVVSLLDIAIMLGYSVFGTVADLDEAGMYQAAPETADVSAQETAAPADVATEAPAAIVTETPAVEWTLPADLRLEELPLGDVLEAMFEKARERAAAQQLAPALMAGPQTPAPLAWEEAAPAPLTEEEFSTVARQTIMNELLVAGALGFGESVYLIVLAPLVLLFSYTKVPRSPKVGIAIPAAGMILILFLFLEGIRLMVGRLGASKVDLDEMSGHLQLLQTIMK